MIESYPEILDVADVAQILRLSRAGAYQLIHSDGFPVLRIGKRLLVPRYELERWIEYHTTGGAPLDLSDIGNILEEINVIENESI